MADRKATQAKPTWMGVVKMNPSPKKTIPKKRTVLFATAVLTALLLAQTSPVRAQTADQNDLAQQGEPSWTSYFASAQDPGDEMNPPPRDRQQRDGFDRPERGQRPGGPPRGMRPPGERGPGEGPPQQFTKERIQEAVKFIEQNFPRMHVEMMKLRDRNPQRFRQRMRNILPDIMHLMEVNAHDPQMGSLLIRERQLDMRIRHTVFRYHKTEDETEKKALQKEIKETVNEVFDVQLQRRELEITSLKLRIQQLESGLTEQQDMRDQLIRQRIKNMLENKPPALRNRSDDGSLDRPPLEMPPPQD